MIQLRRRPASLLLVALALAAPACTSWSHERYLARIGILTGQQEVLDRYEQALARRDFGALLDLCDRDPAAQRSGADAVAQLRTGLGPIAAADAVIDSVEAEVRDFDLFAEHPTANLFFRVNARLADGTRTTRILTSFTTFRIVSTDAPERDPDGMPLGHLAILAQDAWRVSTQSGHAMHYEDATAKAHLVDRHRNQTIDKKCLILQGTMPGSGAAAADFDGDGRLDLAAIDGQASHLYLNQGDGTFAEASAQWGIDRFSGAGCVSADYDNDGDEDLYILDHFGGTRLLRNDGDRFVDVTAESGAGVADPTFSAAFADIDRDGDLDLFVPCAGDYYSQVPMPPFMARDGKPDRLFINDGHGHFTDDAHARGVDDSGWGLAASFCDYDGDGDDDLYVANDFGLNQLFQNDGTGHFKDVAPKTGASDRGYGMGISWGDVDNDGKFDAYVSDIWSEFNPVFLDPDYPLPLIGRLFRGWVGRELNRMGLGNALLRSQGDGTFSDVAKTWHVNECGWAWAGMFLDFDDDGDLDIYCPDGSYTGPSADELELRFWALSSLMWERSKMQQWLFDAQGRSLQGHERNRLFEQRGASDFAEVGYVHGVDAIETGRGLAIGDFDDDGYPDLYLRNLNDRAIYYRNTGGTNHWLRLTLVGTRCNKGAVGAVVKATAGGTTQMRQITAGEGFYSSHDKRPLFGLGAATRAEVEVRWPSGAVEKFGALATDQGYVLVEGSGQAQPFQPKPRGAANGGGAK